METCQLIGVNSEREMRSLNLFVHKQNFAVHYKPLSESREIIQLLVLNDHLRCELIHSTFTDIQK